MTPKRWVPLAVATIATVCAGAPAFACKCALVPRARTIVATPLVFEGRVLKIDAAREAKHAIQVTTLKVLKSIKGRSPGNTVMVYTHTDSASCGFDFHKAKPTLLVGAYRDEKRRLSVRRCTMYNLNR
jgi:hypothetical protein